MCVRLPAEIQMLKLEKKIKKKKERENTVCQFRIQSIYKQIQIRYHCKLDIERKFIFPRLILRSLIMKESLRKK